MASTPLWKALTLYQPWASDVADGRKSWETRSWYTRYRGTLVIHAGKSREFIGRGSMKPTGCIVAVSKLVAVRPTELMVATLDPEEIALGDYTPGRYAWMLDDIVKLRLPIPAKGARGLWDVTPETREQIIEATEQWTVAGRGQNEGI